MWDGIVMQRLAVVSPETGGVSTIATSPDGSLLVLGGGTTSMINDEIKGDGFLRFYDLRCIGPTSKTAFKITTGQTDTDSVIFSPDQQFVLSCQCNSSGAEILLFDLRMERRQLHTLKHETLKDTHRPPQEQSSVIAWAWWPDGELVTGGADSCIRVWDLSLPSPELVEHRLQTDCPISALSLGPNLDKSLLLAGTESGAVFIWSASKATITRIQKHLGAHGEGSVFSF